MKQQLALLFSLSYYHSHIKIPLTGRFETSFHT